jgi:hypothetical protein
MNGMWIIVYAGIAAVGNALFALGQTSSSGIQNGLSFVAASALIACVLALAAAPLLGPMDPTVVFREHGKSLLLSGTGLFLTDQDYAADDGGSPGGGGGLPEEATRDRGRRRGAAVRPFHRPYPLTFVRG